MERIELEQFNGTEQYYKGFLGVLNTDGVQYLALNGASWLVTDISSIVRLKTNVKDEEFVAIKVIVENSEAVAEYSDGNGKLLYLQKYAYTDLSEGEYKFYFTDNVLMLAGEY